MDKKYLTKEGKKQLQQKLMAAGYNVGKSGIDGILGKDTGAAVRAFQKANGLAVDGILGNKTIAALERTSSTTKDATEKTEARKPTSFRDKQVPPKTIDRTKFKSLNDREDSTQENAEDSSEEEPYKKVIRKDYSGRDYWWSSDGEGLTDEELMELKASKANIPRLTQDDRSIFQKLASSTQRLKRPFEKGDNLLAELTGANPAARLIGGAESALENPTWEGFKNLGMDALQSIPFFGTGAKTGKTLAEANRLSKLNKATGTQKYSNYIDEVLERSARSRKGWETRRANAKPDKNLGGFLQSISPLLGMIPGAGIPLAAGANIAGGLMNQPQDPYQVPPQAQQNTNRFGYAYGGQLNQLSSNTTEVEGTNPDQVDGVELPNAMVDHGETITNDYVYSDTLVNPLTNNTFAKDNKKLALSTAKAEEKVNDPEAANTVMFNNIFQKVLADTNEVVRKAKMYKEDFGYGGAGSKSKSADKLYEKKNGGYLGKSKEGYFSGGNPLLDMLNALPDRNFMQNEYTGAMPNPFQGSVPPSANAAWGAVNAAPVPQGTTPTDYQANTKYNIANTIQPANQVRQYNPASASLPTLPIGSLGSNRIPDDPLKRYSSSDGTDQSMNNELSSGIQDQKNPWAFLDDPKLAAGLQFGELAAKTALLGRGYDKQKLYQNQAPINLRQYDPSQILNQNQRSFAAQRQGINNSATGGTRLANLQQAYANKYNADTRAISQYDERNKQAQDQYEGRLGQRQAENIQRKYATDQIRQQDEAAFYNSLQDILTSVGNVGRAKNKQNTNKKAVEMIISAYPDLAKFINV